MEENNNERMKPTYFGYIESTHDALIVIQATQLGMLRRWSRRMNEAEKKEHVISGSIFVYAENESGIRRWTDGKLWSPSRVRGNFLIYSQVVSKLSASSSLRKRKSHSADSSLPGAIFGSKGAYVLMTEADALIKKTISVTLNNDNIHLVAYFARSDVKLRTLVRPTEDLLRTVRIPQELVNQPSFRRPLKLKSGTTSSSMSLQGSTPTSAAMTMTEGYESETEDAEDIEGKFGTSSSSGTFVSSITTGTTATQPYFLGGAFECATPDSALSLETSLPSSRDSTTTTATTTPAGRAYTSPQPHQSTVTVMEPLKSSLELLMDPSNYDAYMKIPAQKLTRFPEDWVNPFRSYRQGKKEKGTSSLLLPLAPVVRNEEGGGTLHQTQGQREEILPIFTHQVFEFPDLSQFGLDFNAPVVQEWSSSQVLEPKETPQTSVSPPEFSNDFESFFGLS